MSLQATWLQVYAYLPATLRTTNLKAALSAIIDTEPQSPEQQYLEIRKENVQVEIELLCASIEVQVNFDQLIFEMG